MSMGLKQTVKTSFSTIGTTLGTIDSTATLAKNYIDEAIQVQQQTSALRIKKSVLEAQKDLAQDIILLTEAEKDIIKQLNEVELSELVTTTTK